MISSLSKSIKQFASQLKSLEAGAVGQITIIWVDSDKEDYELDDVLSIDHEYNAKDGSIIIKGKRRSPSNKEGAYLITTKLKYIYSITFTVDIIKEEYPL